MNGNRTRIHNYTSTCMPTKIYSLYHHYYSKLVLHITKQLLIFTEVTNYRVILTSYSLYDISLPRSGNIMNVKSYNLRVRFGDPDHDRVMRTKTWSGAKTTWSS